MSVDKVRLEIINDLNQVDDISLLLALKAVLHYGLKNEGRISIDQYNREIAEAEKRIEQGEFIVHEEAIKQISEWRKSGD